MPVFWRGSLPSIWRRNPRRSSKASGGQTSTYGSFSYLLYGPFRLFSQLAQDCEYKTGKVLWIAGHSGPETAEGQPYPLRRILPRGYPVLPQRQGDQSASLGIQRRTGASCGGFQSGCSHYCPAPDPAEYRDSRPQGHRHGPPLRGRQRRLPYAGLQARRG